MAVKRIVANIGVSDLQGAEAFYSNILGMNVAMNHGWIITFATSASTTPQVNIAIEGGSETAVPDLSIEVDDLDEVSRKMVQAGIDIDHGPATEPWGVRRFYVCDPFGRLLNILNHSG